MSKICSTCNTEKDLAEFYQRKKHRTGEYYEKCKDCFKKRGKEYYNINRERQLFLANKRKREYREIRKRLVWEAKNKPCSDCGKRYNPWIMDLDHRQGEEKLFSLSTTFNGSNILKLEIIEQEIAKCDVVCSNCHRQRTYDRLHNTNALVAKMVKANV